MDTPASATSVLDTLRTVEFRLGLKGYNVDEVDEYLEKAAVEAEALKEQMRLTNERLQQATQRLAQLESEDRPAPQQAQAPAPEEAPAESSPAAADDTLQRTLVLAQRFVEQTRRESEAEASDRVARAEEEATVILAQAEDRARQTTEHGERRLREEVARLETLQAQLNGDVDSLTRHLESERSRLRGSLSEMLKFLDEKIQLSSLTAGSTRSGASSGKSPGSSRASSNGGRQTSDEGSRGHVPGSDSQGGLHS